VAVAPLAAAEWAVAVAVQEVHSAQLVKLADLVEGAAQEALL
jgi:hypothetical protein